MLKNKLKQENGMTFIVLILTIIVIIIFLSFAMVMITGENGILVPKSSSSGTVNETAENIVIENGTVENEISTNETT